MKINKWLLLGMLHCATLAGISVATAQTEDGASRSGLFFAAIRRGDAATVRSQLTVMPSLANGTDSFGSPLTVAIQSGRLEIFKALLESGANPQGGANEDPALFRVLQQSDETVWRPMAEMLLARGAPLDVTNRQGSTVMMAALQSSRATEKIQFLLDKGATITPRNHEGRTVLEMALQNGNVPEAKLLLSKADPKYRDERGNSLLHVAVAGGNPDIVKLLLAKEFPLNAQNLMGDTPLHLAVPRSGALVKLLVGAGANVNLANKAGDLPLHLGLRHWPGLVPALSEDSDYEGDYDEDDGDDEDEGTQSAASRGRGQLRTISDPDVLSALIEKTNVNSRDRFGLSPLLLAVLYRDKNAVELIRDRAPQTDELTRLFVAAALAGPADPALGTATKLGAFRLPDGTTLLHVAAQWGNVASLRFLLAHGVDINARDALGQSALHRALLSPTGLYLRRSKLAVAVLLQAGASVNGLDAEDVTPLLLAAQNGDVDLISVLLDKGASVNLPSKNGQTPLLALISAKASGKLIGVLLDKGANLAAHDSNGFTALLIAVRTGQTELVKQLLARGADVNQTSTQGQSALSLAVASSPDPDLVGALLAKGADPNSSSEGQSIIARFIQYQRPATLEIVKQLIATKKLQLKPRSGEISPLRLAVSNRRLDLAALFIEAGSDVNEVDASGQSLLKLATRQGANSEIVQLLKAKGATDPTL